MGKKLTNIERILEFLKTARHAVAFTGAGISTPSGIPDFRSKQSGLWERYDPLETASLRIFRQNPRRFWDWKGPLMLRVWESSPNPAHLALAQLEKAGRLKALITQNIDGLHQRAGSVAVYELHGTIDTMHCPRCHQGFASRDFQQVLIHDEMPSCPQDGTILKPDVVLFGENLPSDVWQGAEDHILQADLLLAIGSSLQVQPAASLPMLAAQQGARLVILNRDPTPLDDIATLVERGDVADVLPQIAAPFLSK